MCSEMVPEELSEELGEGKLDRSPVTLEASVDPIPGFVVVTALQSCTKLKERGPNFAPGPIKQLFNMGCPGENDVTLAEGAFFN